MLEHITSSCTFSPEQRFSNIAVAWPPKSERTKCCVWIELFFTQLFYSKVKATFFPAMTIHFLDKHFFVIVVAAASSSPFGNKVNVVKRSRLQPKNAKRKTSCHVKSFIYFNYQSTLFSEWKVQMSLTQYISTT